MNQLLTKTILANNFSIQIYQNNDTISSSELCKYFENGFGLILDTTTNSFDWTTVSKIADDFKVPYLKIDLSISPILRMLDAYLNTRNATDIVIIFDNENDVDKAMIYWMNRTNLRLRVIHGMGKSAKANLQNTIVLPSFYIMVAHTKNMFIMLKMAQANKLLRFPERWIFVFLDLENQTEIRSLLLGLPVSLLSYNSMCRMEHELASSTCSNNHIYEEFLKNFLLFVTNISIDLHESDSDKTSPTINCSIPRNVPIKLFYDHMTTRNQSIFTYDENSIFTMNVNAIIELGMKNGSFELLGTYNDLKLNFAQGKTIKPNRHFYRVATGVATPWIYRETDPNTGEIRVKGYCIDLIEKLAEVMNFNYDLEVSDGDYGTLFPNGTWDGLVGGLISGAIDIVVAPMTMTAEREEVIDFATPYFETSGITIVTRRPVMKTSFFKFLEVLRLEVWLSIMGSLIIMSLMLWILDYCSPFSSRNKKYPHPCRVFDFKESFWFSLTSFTPHGGGEVPQSLSGRILVAAYWIFVVLILTTFTASLSAFLTVERMQIQTPKFNLADLSRQSRINYTVKKNSWPLAYFKNMQNTEDQLYNLWRQLALNKTDQYRIWDYPIKEQYGSIVKAIIEAVPVENVSEGYRMVLEHTDGDFAFIHDYSEIRYALGRICNLIEVGEPFAERPYAVAVQQGSKLLTDVSNALATLKREGYLNILKEKYWGANPNENCEEYTSDGITVMSLGGVFIATISVLLLAVITLIYEIINIKRNNVSNKIKNIKPDKQDIFFVKNNKFKHSFEQNETVTIGTTFRPVVGYRFKNTGVAVVGRNSFTGNSTSINQSDY